MLAFVLVLALADVQLETENFIVTAPSDAQAKTYAQRVERARGQTYSLWFDGEANPPWTPKCRLILHPNAAALQASTPQLRGAAYAASPGFALSEFLGGAWRRRLELRLDHPVALEGVLPHEIAHTCFAGKFPKGRPPRWADEGMAVLTEPAEIQHRHLKALVESRAGGVRLAAAGLVVAAEFPPQRVAEGYAHSVALCRLLVERGGHAKFVAFLREAEGPAGYDQALQKWYQLDGLRGLDAALDAYAQMLATAFKAYPAGP